MKLIPWVLRSRKAKVDEAHALSTRDTCSDIVSLESSTTPSTLSVDTLSAPSMNGRSGSILGYYGLGQFIPPQAKIYPHDINHDINSNERYTHDLFHFSTSF